MLQSLYDNGLQSTARAFTPQLESAARQTGMTLEAVKVSITTNHKYIHIFLYPYKYRYSFFFFLYHSPQARIGNMRRANAMLQANPSTSTSPHPSTSNETESPSQSNNHASRVKNSRLSAMRTKRTTGFDMFKRTYPPCKFFYNSIVQTTSHNPPI